MGLFDFIKRIFSSPPRSSVVDERRETAPPSSTTNRDYDTKPVDPPASFPPVNAPPTQQPSGGQTYPYAEFAPVDAEVIEDQPRQARAAFSADKLDTDKFAPISRDDAMEATSGENWVTAYFDSLRDIPSDELPRIRVIDRTMVGLGLITEAELAEIHEVGHEMDLYRHHHRAIDTAGQQAVNRSRAEQQRRKEAKQQEAAQRRLKRAAEIATRRAADIVYLGRGVSKGLSDRRANVERLKQNGLPILATPAEVASAMGLTIPELRWLAYHSEAPTRMHYVNFQVPKKSGGVRTLASPHKKLAEAQAWILQNVLNPVQVHAAAHGFVKGHSTVTNARPHVGAAIVVNADLTDFFPTINFYRAEGMFRGLGYSPAAATIFALLCTESPRQEVQLAGETLYPAVGPRCLPQGACTSPAISNLIARSLDKRLTGIANSLGWMYTRYADDLTFSFPSTTAEGSSEPPAPNIGYLLARLRHICQDEGFAANEKKTRILRNNAQQNVTGIVVNDKPGVPRKTVRRLRAILHRAKHEGLAAQNRENHPNFTSWLQGMIAYVEMVDPDKGGKLRREFESLNA